MPRALGARALERGAAVVDLRQRLGVARSRRASEREGLQELPILVRQSTSQLRQLISSDFFLLIFSSKFAKMKNENIESRLTENISFKKCS